MRVNCPLPQIKWCWVFQARGCRTRRCSISAPLVTSRWTDARRMEPAGKLEILLGLPLSPHAVSMIVSSKSEGISGSVSNCKLIEIQNIKIFASTNWDFSSNFYFLFDWNSPRIEQSNCCWPNSFLSEWPNAAGVSECERKEIRRERELNQTLFIFIFRPYLESVKSRCVDSCSRDRCMASVREFYRKIPKQHSLDIAFCLCK